MNWANRYLNTHTTSTFPDRVSASRRAKFFPIPKVFNLVFVLGNPSFIGLLSQQLYWIIGLSHYSLHPVPWEDEEIQPWEKSFCISRTKTSPKIQSENMLESKSMSLWWRITEPELKQGLFFQIEVSGALTRGWEIILNKICLEKITDSKLERCTHPLPLISVIDHDTINYSLQMVSKVAKAAVDNAALAATSFHGPIAAYFHILHTSLWESAQISAPHS